MADDSHAAGEESEAQITFHVKSSSDHKHLLTLPASTTIADVKQRLSAADSADTPPERQRLIYSGRVLKDHDTLGGVKIKDGNTVHLVKTPRATSARTPPTRGAPPPHPPPPDNRPPA
ncbi:ubiquitin-like protein, partial [Teratosphaeria destructans]